MKSQGLCRVWRSVLDLFYEGANLWYCRYFFIYSLAPSNVLGQYYPCLMTLWVRDHPPAWFPQSPSWISCIALLASFEPMHLNYGSECNLEVSEAILGSWDLYGVATGEFRFPSSNNLQVRGHSIIFDSALLTWLTMSSESQWTSSSAIQMVAAFLRPSMTASYSALLLVAWNSRV